MRPAAGDDAAADAGADGDVAEVLGTAAGAEAPFGNSGGVGVVVDMHGHAQVGAELLTEGNVGEVAEGRGAADDPRGRVDRPEGTDPDEPQRPGRLGGRVLDLVDYGGDDRRRPAVTRGGDAVASEHHPARGEHGGPELSAAEVHDDQRVAAVDGVTGNGLAERDSHDLIVSVRKLCRAMRIWSANPA